MCSSDLAYAKQQCHCKEHDVACHAVPLDAVDACREQEDTEYHDVQPVSYTHILEADTEYRFLPQRTARIGQFKTMYTIENPMSPCFVELINCYSQAVSYTHLCSGSGIRML